jgi:hypothetical protein
MRGEKEVKIFVFCTGLISILRRENSMLMSEGAFYPHIIKLKQILEISIHLLLFYLYHNGCACAIKIKFPVIFLDPARIAFISLCS